MKKTTASNPNNPFSLWWRSCNVCWPKERQTDNCTVQQIFPQTLNFSSVEVMLKKKRVGLSVLPEKQLGVWQMNNLQICQRPRQASWFVAPCPQFTCRTLLTILSCAMLRPPTLPSIIRVASFYQPTRTQSTLETNYLLDLLHRQFWSNANGMWWKTNLTLLQPSLGSV